MGFSWELFGGELAATVGKRVCLSTRNEEWGVRIQCLLVSVAWVITGLQDAEKLVGGFFNKSAKVLKLTVFKRLMPVSKQHPLILESQPLGLIGSLSFHFS